MYARIEEGACTELDVHFVLAYVLIKNIFDGENFVLSTMQTAVHLWKFCIVFSNLRTYLDRAGRNCKNIFSRPATCNLIEF